VFWVSVLAGWCGQPGVFPGLLAISALMLTLQTALVIATRSMLFFLLQFPLASMALCVLFARTAPTRKPLVAQLAAEVAGLRLPSPRYPGLDLFFQEPSDLQPAFLAVTGVVAGASGHRVPFSQEDDRVEQRHPRRVRLRR
jgi:hypothetical protein